MKSLQCVYIKFLLYLRWWDPRCQHHTSDS